MRIRILLSVAVALFCTALQAQTITSVEGMIVDGSELTLRGSGFGQRAAQAPEYWNDFETSLDGLDVESSPGLYAARLSELERHQGQRALEARLGDPNIETAYSTERQGFSTYWFPEALRGGDKIFISF